MRKGLTRSEVLDVTMQPDSSSELEDVSSSPSDTTDSGESDPDVSSSPSDTTDSGESDPDVSSSPSDTTDSGESDPDVSSSPSDTTDSGESDPDVSSSPSDTTDSGESDPDLDVPPSSSSLASTEGEEDSEDPGSGWIGRNGEVWFSTNAETTPFLQPARVVTPGPTHYAIARVQNIDSVFNLFFTEEMIDLIVSMTNLHGRRTMRNWTGMDSTDLRAYMWLLILAGVYRSRG